MSAAAGTLIVDAKSYFATPSELDIFSVPVTQIAVRGGHWERVRTKNQLDSHGPWTFELDTGGFYCQPCKNYVCVKLKIVRTDTPGDLGNADVVGPINKLASTFFKTVKIYIGSKLISDSHDLYPYRCILESELSYGSDAKKAGHLKAGLYCQDEPPNHLEDGENKGFIWRKRWFAGSKTVELMAPITSDLFNTQRVLPTHTKLRIDLYRNTDEFCLMQFNADGNANRTYEIQVVDMEWRVRMLDLSPSASVGLDTALLKAPAKYPIRLTKLARLSVASGANRTPQNTLFNGQIPRRLVLGAVLREAFNGNIKRNPFIFKNFGLEEITVTAGGVRYHRDPLRMDFANSIYLRAYLQLLESMGLGAPVDKGCHITPELFASGLCLIAFDLSSDECAEGGHWNLNRTGSTYVKARYAQPLTHIEIIAYAEFDSLIRIDHLREAHLAHMI